MSTALVCTPLPRARRHTGRPGGRGWPQPRRQRAAGNAAVQDKPGKVRGCPPTRFPRPRRAARLEMCWRRPAPAPRLLGAPALLPPAPGGRRARARPRSRGGVRGAGGAGGRAGYRGGCQGCSHHQPGLLRAPLGTTPVPAPRPGGDSMAGGCGGPGGQHTGGVPCSQHHFPRALRPHPPGLGQDPLRPLHPQEGAPRSHAAGAPRCQRQCPHPREGGRKLGTTIPPAPAPLPPCRAWRAPAGAAAVPEGAWAQHAGPSEPHGVV